MNDYFNIQKCANGFHITTHEGSWVFVTYKELIAFLDKTLKYHPVLAPRYD